MDKYKLKVVVLHDPDDKGTLRILKHDYDRVNEETGDDLLFLTFFTPPNRKRGGAYCFSKERMSGERDFSRSQMYRLRQRLNLDHIPFPMMLVTEDVDSDRFCVAQMNGEKFPEALLDLSALVRASDVESPFGEAEIQRALAGYQSNIFEKTADFSLADILTSFFAREIVAKGPVDDSMEKSLLFWGMDNKTLLTKAIRAELDKEIPDNERYERILVKQIEDDTFWDDFMRALSRRAESRSSEHPRIGNVMSFQVRRENTSAYDVHDAPRPAKTLLEIDSRLLAGCEKESHVDYESFMEFTSNPLSHGRPDRDYAGWAFYLNKIIEIELNHSLVQEMRACLGIEMPEYYCKYKDGGGEYIVRFRSNIYKLNDKKDGCWNPLTMGAIFGAYATMESRKVDYGFLPLKEQFRRELFSFYNRRNDPSHSRSMDYDEFLEHFQNFLRLLKFFPELMKRKEAVRGRERK